MQLSYQQITYSKNVFSSFFLHKQQNNSKAKNIFKNDKRQFRLIFSSILLYGKIDKRQDIVVN